MTQPPQTEETQEMSSPAREGIVRLLVVYDSLVSAEARCKELYITLDKEQYLHAGVAWKEKIRQLETHMQEAARSIQNIRFDP